LLSELFLYTYRTPVVPGEALGLLAKLGLLSQKKPSLVISATTYS